MAQSVNLGDTPNAKNIPYEMWDHIENVTGKKCIWRPKYFSCSC
jgi:hypothetical protein